MNLEERELVKSFILDNPLINEHSSPLIPVGLVEPQLDETQYLDHSSNEVSSPASVSKFLVNSGNYLPIFHFVISLSSSLDARPTPKTLLIPKVRFITLDISIPISSILVDPLFVPHFLLTQYFYERGPSFLLVPFV
jgi:hypothetical protein